MQTEKLERIVSPYTRIIHQTNPNANSQLYAIAVVHPIGDLYPSEVQSHVAVFRIGQELIKERGLSLLLQTDYSQAKINALKQEKSSAQRVFDDVKGYIGAEKAEQYLRSLSTYSDEDLHTFFCQKN